MSKANQRLIETQAWIERYFPCSFERGGPILVILGIVSAIVYAYTNIWYRGEFRNGAENLMALTFFISAWGQRRQLKSDLVFRLMALAFLIPLCLYAINMLLDFETANKYRSLNELIKLFFFLPLAWWMGGSRAGAARMLLIAFLGLLTAVVLDPNVTQNLDRLWSMSRVDFNVHNAQHGALLFGLVVIYCVCHFFLRDWHLVSIRTNIVLVLSCLVGFAGVLATQTRATYLGLFACGLIVVLQWIKQTAFARHNNHRTVKMLVFVAVFTALILGLVKDIEHGRLAVARADINTLITSNLNELPFGSVGIRVHSWTESLNWIAQRPVTGWGHEARLDVISQADHFPEDIKNRFGHLHSGYLELLLGFGAIGLVFVVVFWIVVLKRIRLAASRELYAFAFYGSALFLVMNLFESLFFYWSGLFAMSLFLAAGYSQYLARNLVECSPGGKTETVDTSTRTADRATARM